MSQFDAAAKASEFITKSAQSFNLADRERNAILDQVRDEYCALSTEQRRAVLTQIPRPHQSYNASATTIDFNDAPSLTA